MYNRARSVLAETEEPTVLTQILRTETEIEPTCICSMESKRNRNRMLEPRLTEKAVFIEKCTILPCFNISCSKRQFKLIEKNAKSINRLKKIITILITLNVASKSCSIFQKCDYFQAKIVEFLEPLEPWNRTFQNRNLKLDLW